MTFDALTILVIHHKTPQLLSDCLERLSRFARGARVIVVDSSPPKTVAVLGPALQQLEPPAELISVPNHSFAYALNCGLKCVETPYVAHLNADVFVTSKTFPALLEALGLARVAVVGPRVHTLQGRLQDQGVGYRVHYRRLARGSQRGRTSLSVPWLSGCLQVLKMEAVQQVGGMDASLRFYNEDMEWCFRLRRAGWLCQLVETEVLHLGGASTPNDPRFLVEGYRGGYRLSQRYKGALYTEMHCAVVLAQSAWMRRFAKTQTAQKAFAEIFEMFRRGSFDDSPFGPTLNSPSAAAGKVGLERAELEATRYRATSVAPSPSSIN